MVIYFRNLNSLLLRSMWKVRYNWKLWRGEISITGHPIHPSVIFDNNLERLVTLAFTLKYRKAMSSHKYDLDRDHWFKLEMARFIEADETLPETPQVGVVLSDYRFGFKTWNILARYETVREYWGAMHARKLLRKQFPDSFLTNEPGAVAIKYSGIE